jgi:hypothetical protein
MSGPAFRPVARRCRDYPTSVLEMRKSGKPDLRRLVRLAGGGAWAGRFPWTSSSGSGFNFDFKVSFIGAQQAAIGYHGGDDGPALPRLHRGAP